MLKDRDLVIIVSCEYPHISANLSYASSLGMKIRLILSVRFKPEADIYIRIINPKNGRFVERECIRAWVCVCGCACVHVCM